MELTGSLTTIEQSMSQLSGLGAISKPTLALPGAGVAFAPNQQTAPPPAAPTLSSSYTPTLVSASDPLTYVIPPIGQAVQSTTPGAPVWQNTPTDAISQILTSDVAAKSLSGCFAGLGAALLDRFKTASTNYSQSVSLPPPPGESPVVANLINARNNNVFGQIELDITTVSGTKVELDIVDQGKLSVQISTSASLTTAEQKALVNLAKGFQSAIDGFTASTPSIDLSGLIQYDPTVLSSVNLTMQFGGEQNAMSLNFQANNTARSIAASLPIGQVNFNLNLANSAIIGTAAQQATALNNYLQQFAEEESRDQGENPVLTKMFTDGFTQINSNYPPQNPLSNPLNTIFGPTVKTEQDHAMFTGLPDFQAGVTQTPVPSNPLKLDETDQFSYSVSQETTIGGTDYADRDISQQQNSSLIASYHKLLVPGQPLALTVDPKSQNYYYEQLSDNSSVTTNIAYHHNSLIRASITKSASQSTHETKFVQGIKTEDTTTVISAAEDVELLALLQPFQSNLPQNAAKWKKVLAEINSQVYLQSNPTLLPNSTSTVTNNMPSQAPTAAQ